MVDTKKCPWCGCSAVVRPSALGYFVECSKNGHIHNIGCFDFEKSFRKTEQEAIKAWNDCVKKHLGR